MGMAPEFLICCRGLLAGLYNESSFCHVSFRASVIKELHDYTNLPRFMLSSQNRMGTAQVGSDLQRPSGPTFCGKWRLDEIVQHLVQPRLENLQCGDSTMSLQMMVQGLIVLTVKFFLYPDETSQCNFYLLSLVLSVWLLMKRETNPLCSCPLSSGTLWGPPKSFLLQVEEA